MVTVVLPCFNERDHVELEIKRIRAALEAAGLSFEDPPVTLLGFRHEL